MKERFRIIQLNNEICEFDWTVKPKGSVPEHFHRDSDEYFKVLNGEVTIKVNDKINIVKTGEELLVPKLTSHSIRNNSNEIVKCRVCFKPVADQGKFFQILLFLNRINPNDGSALFKAMYISEQMKYQEFSTLQGGMKFMMKILMRLFKLIAPIIGWKKLLKEYDRELKSNH
jgi:quercetin dioxygenase-like cupin family protein